MSRSSPGITQPVGEMRHRRLVLAAIACVAILVVATPASAQQPFLETYSGDSGVAGEVASGGPWTTPTKGDAGSAASSSAASSLAPDPPATDSLPFTGSEVLRIGMLGVGLLGTGLLARRLTHREP